MKCLFRLVFLGILLMIGVSFFLSEQGDVTKHIATGIRDELLTSERIEDVVDGVLDTTKEQLAAFTATTTKRELSVPYTTNTGIEGTIHVMELQGSSYAPRVSYDQASPKTLRAWAEIYPNDVIINASYFHPDLSPSGFVVVDGKRVGERAFDISRSGALVATADSNTIRDLSEADLEQPEQFLAAIQSFPYIIKHGEGAIQEDSGLRARRTTVGIDAEGDWYIIIVEEHSLTLYQLMEKLLETGIPFQHVLNLDGGPSTGVIAQESGKTIHNYDAIPGIIRFVEQ